jgi:hypothetical protein
MRAVSEEGAAARKTVFDAHGQRRWRGDVCERITEGRRALGDPLWLVDALLLRLVPVREVHGPDSDGATGTEEEWCGSLGSDWEALEWPTKRPRRGRATVSADVGFRLGVDGEVVVGVAVETLTGTRRTNPVWDLAEFSEGGTEIPPSYFIP